MVPQTFSNETDLDHMQASQVQSVFTKTMFFYYYYLVEYVIVLNWTHWLNLIHNIFKHVAAVKAVQVHLPGLKIWMAENLTPE